MTAAFLELTEFIAPGSREAFGVAALSSLHTGIDSQGQDLHCDEPELRVLWEAWKAGRSRPGSSSSES